MIGKKAGLSNKPPRIVTYLDGLQAKVNALRELQSASGEELSVLMPSVLDKASKENYEQRD